MGKITGRQILEHAAEGANITKQLENCMIFAVIEDGTVFHLVDAKVPLPLKVRRFDAQKLASFLTKDP